MARKLPTTSYRPTATANPASRPSRHPPAHAPAATARPRPGTDRLGAGPAAAPWAARGALGPAPARSGRCQAAVPLSKLLRGVGAPAAALRLPSGRAAPEGSVWVSAPYRAPARPKRLRRCPSPRPAPLTGPRCSKLRGGGDAALAGGEGAAQQQLLMRTGRDRRQTAAESAQPPRCPAGSACRGGHRGEGRSSRALPRALPTGCRQRPGSGRRSGGPCRAEARGWHLRCLLPGRGGELVWGVPGWARQRWDAGVD